MHRFFLKLRRRRALQQDLETELAFHREMAAAHHNPIPLGNTTVIREEALELWRFTFLENLWRDLVYAARALRRNPGLVATALFSLALGIGANTAVFSIAAEFLFSEPSVRDAASVVSITLGGNSHSRREAIESLRASSAFADVAGETDLDVNWNDGTVTRRIFGMTGSRNFLSAMGVPMAYGRGWNAGDGAQVAVLCHHFWQRYFNGDPSVVGRSISLNGRPYTVLGILPRNHRTVLGFGFSPDVYLPVEQDSTFLSIYARLKPGTSAGEARAAVAVVARRLDSEFPERWKYADEIKVTPLAGIARLQNGKMMPVNLFFIMLLAVVGLVLLIACVNVASLLLARGSARRQEIAIRLSLGASRGRLVQQLLAESLVLSLLGAGFGLGLAWLGTRLLSGVSLPLPMPVRLEMEGDWRVALYAALLAVVSTAVSGLLPAWQAVRESLGAQLHRERRLRMRRVLVAAQVAVSVVVLATGFLFLRNLFEAASLSPGFDLRHTVRAGAHLPPAGYKDPARKFAYAQSVLRELTAVPGVEAAAAAQTLPFIDFNRFGAQITFPDTGERKRVRFEWNAVTPEFFRAMEIPVLAGRVFTAREAGFEKPVIVNRAFVERYLGSREPLNTVFIWGESKTPWRIAGVVGGTKVMSIGEDDRAQLYEPLNPSNSDRPIMHFILRSAIPPAAQLAPVREVLRRIEPEAGSEVATLESSIGMAFLPSRVGAGLLGTMGLLGLVLAAIGLYGVMAYSVTRRNREIGVRMALGAAGGAISRMVLGEAARILIAGSAAGLAVALLVMRPLALFLVPGLSPTDPASFAGVLLVLAITGLLAALGPARRAASVDPMSSLRDQ